MFIATKRPVKNDTSVERRVRSECHLSPHRAKERRKHYAQRSYANSPSIAFPLPSFVT